MSSTDIGKEWAVSITAEPATRESIRANLKTLLNGSSINGTQGKPAEQSSREALLNFIWNLDLESKPSSFDPLWHAIFDIAEEDGCTAEVREQTYYWTENLMINGPWDANLDEDEESQNEKGEQEFDERFIATSLGAARLFTLRYGYSSFAWNTVLSGLGKLEENSDSYRIAACAQLLGAGQRLKVFLHGGGDEKQTPGFAGKYLSQRSWTERSEWKKTGPENWKGWIKALEDQTSVAGPRAAAILKVS